MSLLPPGLARAVEAALGVPVRRAEPTRGGMVAPSALVTAGSGRRAFVKWKPDAPPRFFACEADGLARLSAVGALDVPDVLAWADREGLDDPGTPPFLILSPVEVAPPRDPARFARRLGEGLAALHLAPAPAFFGLERDNFLGSQPQENTPTADWPAFYRDRRLRPQLERAGRLGLLPPRREAALRSVLERTPELLSGLVSRPALVHGDLWAGNFLCAAGDRPVLIDPAVHYAEREVELAYTELFSGFPAGYLDAYRAVYPIADGYDRRRPLHQLYPLLIHLNHFGEEYGPWLDRAAAECQW